MSKSKLEKEFDLLIEKNGGKLNERISTANLSTNSNEAAEALKEAIILSDKTGIPFGAQVIAYGKHSIMRLDNNYVPKSYFEKFSSLDPKKVADITNVSVFALSPKSPNEDDFDSSEEDEEEGADYMNDGWRSSYDNC